MKAELYADDAGAWRWRIRARNGRIVACSGESFHGQREAMRSLDRLCAQLLRPGLKTEVIER